MFDCIVKVMPRRLSKMSTLLVWLALAVQAVAVAHSSASELHDSRQMRKALISLKLLTRRQAQEAQLNMLNLPIAPRAALQIGPQYQLLSKQYFDTLGGLALGKRSNAVLALMKQRPMKPKRSENFSQYFMTGDDKLSDGSDEYLQETETHTTNPIMSLKLLKLLEAQYLSELEREASNS